MRTARLLAELSPERVELLSSRALGPRIGDIVHLDQGFTFPDGRPGGMVSFVGPDGRTDWTADVYDSEIEVLGQ
jgi:hypothetical protein